jgi:hypothetical protein
VNEHESNYEVRYGWSRQAVRNVIIGVVFVGVALVPIWGGRVRLDGILMPTLFLPILRVVDVLLFGSLLVTVLWNAITQKVTLRVDHNGIAFGSGSKPGSVIPWRDVRAVEVFIRQVEAGRRTTSIPYVGVYRPVGAPAVTGASKQAGNRSLQTPAGPIVAASRGINGVAFDRDRFAAAVKWNAPDVPLNISPEFAAA